MNGTPPSRRAIRLFPDYGRDWPLWEDSTPTWDVGYTTTPDDYGLSDALRRDIAAWNALWETNFDPFDGWKDAASREAWRAAGEGVAACLADEVSAFADVWYEPWPLDAELARFVASADPGGRSGDDLR